MGYRAGDQNLYRYVSNSPTNFTDPSGLDPGVFVPPRAPGSAVLDAAALVPKPPVTVPQLLGKWEVNMTSFTSKFDPEGGAGLEGTVGFHPDPKLCPTTQSIRLIQVWRVVDSSGWPSLFDKDAKENMAECNEVTTPISSGLVGAVVGAGWRVDYNATIGR